MEKLLLNKNNFVLGLFFLAGIFSFNNVALAADSKINAGILSDVWFSSLSIDQDQDVTIYSSFQNSENYDLSGKATFWINDDKIETVDFDVRDGRVIKLESNWVSEIGDFEIKIIIDSLMNGDEEINPDNLIKKETSIKIEINRNIDIEYITEVSSNVYNNTVKKINKIVESANQKLENAKTKVVLTDSGVTQNTNNTEIAVLNNNSGNNGSIESEGEVAGIEYSKDDVDANWEDNETITSSDSNELVVDQNSAPKLKNSPVDVVKNASITVLQFILKYWQFSFSIFILLLILWFFKRR